MYIKMVNFSLFGKKREFKKLLNKENTIGFYYGAKVPRYKVNGKLFSMDCNKNSVEDFIFCIETVISQMRFKKHIVVYTDLPRYRVEKLLKIFWEVYSNFYSITIFIAE